MNCRFLNFYCVTRLMIVSLEIECFMYLCLLHVFILLVYMRSRTVIVFLMWFVCAIINECSVNKVRVFSIFGLTGTYWKRVQNTSMSRVSHVFCCTWRSRLGMWNYARVVNT
jgi:hypothetical protein